MEFEREEDQRLDDGFLNDLKDFMDQEEITELSIDTSNEAFKIETLSQANFFLRKLQELRLETFKIEDTAAAEIERLTSKIVKWRDQQVAQNARAEEYFVNLLHNFAEEQLADGKKKTLKLPFGSLSFKAQQDKYEYNDEELLKFLESNEALKNSYIAYKPSTKKADLKKEGIVKDNKLFVEGIEIPGITIIPQDVKFTVK